MLRNYFKVATNVFVGFIATLALSMLVVGFVYFLFFVI